MVYEAAHGVEAHMIADLLRREGISGMVQGEYLQGAMGGLPAAGLVRVVVDEDDYERARRVIEHWSSAQVEEAPPPRQPHQRPAAPRWPYFAAGLLLGAFATYLGAGGSGDIAVDVPLCRP
jgi:predicted Fe-Mo cluster-binding NifX family protein